MNDTIQTQRILLALLPFWTPVIPPMGIASLQGYLKERNHQVHAVDANIETQSRSFYQDYFDTLKKLVPQEKQGNFYNTGRELLRNHMMACMNHKDEIAYLELVQELVYKNYYFQVPHSHQLLTRLNQILNDFFQWLETYTLDLLEREQPTVLGLSVYSGTLPASLFAFKLAKKWNPSIRTLMGGGVFADQLGIGSPNLDYFLRETQDIIDHLFIGEGEILLDHLLTGQLPPQQRLFMRRDIGGRILDINQAAEPDLGDFQLEKYPYLVSHTSRSCPFQCSFCSETVQWGKYRKKDARDITAQLKHMYHRYGYQLFMMCDSLINPVVTPLAQACLEEEVSLYWESCIRAEKEVCSIDNTMLWRQGGFYKARVGVESGSQNVLDLMNKKTSVQQIRDAVGALAYAGIKTLTFWIIGHPGETEADFQQTLDLLTEMKDDIYEAEGTPFLYFLTGQSNSDQWMQGTPRLQLYSESAGEMLMTPTWHLDCLPGREETYSRVNRFISHLDKLGIPHPYSMDQIMAADERWKKLHYNAVPALTDFAVKGRYVDENKHIKHRTKMEKTIQDDGDFGF